MVLHLRLPYKREILDTMPIGELQGFARERLKERFAQFKADELPEIEANLPEYVVERAGRKLAVVAGFLDSIPEVFTFFKRADRKVNLASRRSSVLLLNPGGLRYSQDGGIGDTRHYLRNPDKLSELWDKNHDRTFVQMLADLDFGQVVQKIDKGLSKPI